jgi:rod shape determining protein RodA
MFFVAGLKLRYFFAAGGLFLVCAPIIWLFLDEFQKNRILVFLNPEASPMGAGYNVLQSKLAVGSGQIFGKGLLRSMQKQNYLPEAWTDFILAVGAEEMGLVFSLAVIVLFLVFFFLCLHIARHAADRFGQLLVLGMTFAIFFPAMFNIGVVCGALPTKGMALPFFSYGGTHILASFFALGIIFSVGVHTVKDKKRAFLRKIVKN